MKQTFYHISANQLFQLSERLRVTIAEVLGVAFPKEFWKVSFHKRYAIGLFEENGRVVLIPAFQIEGCLPEDSPARLVRENRADILHEGVAYQFFRKQETDPNGNTVIALQQYWSYEGVYEFLREHLQQQRAASSEAGD
jgi:hypothetical protein